MSTCIKYRVGVNCSITIYFVLSSFLLIRVCLQCNHACIDIYIVLYVSLICV